MYKKNTAITGFGIGHFINTTTGAAVTTGTPTCKRTLDGTGGACANAAAYNSDGAVWEIDLDAADMNGDAVILSFTLTDCLPISYTIKTVTKLVSDLNDLSTAQVNAECDTALADYDAATGTEIAAVKAETAAIVADTNELQTNQGNWLTATGFSTHDAAAVKTAIEAAGSHLALIKAQTDDLADGERVDLLIDAIKAKTDNIPASPAAVGSQMDLVNAPNATAVTAIQNGLSTFDPATTEVDVGEILGTALSDGDGALAAGISAFFGVLAPTKDMNDCGSAEIDPESIDTEAIAEAIAGDILSGGTFIKVDSDGKVYSKGGRRPL